MKYLNYLAVLLLSAASVNAQTVKSKKDIVSIDDKPAFSYKKKAMGNEMHVYKLNTQEELFNMVIDTYGTETKVDDGIKLTFTSGNITILSKTFRGKNWDEMILILLQEKVINVNGEVISDNIHRFKSKYDDGNINHTNRN